MEEIKFRAWDSQNKKMWYFDLFDMKSVQESAPYDGVYLFDDNGNKLCLNSFMHGNNPDVTIMQYTGIKDKNGAEIYVGDIVRLGNNPIHDGVLVECQFSKKRAMYVYRFITGENKGKATDMVDSWRSYEKIGTIYENPELLEK